MLNFAQCFGSALVSMQIRNRIHLFTSMRIRILGVKQLQIYADPDPGQTLPSQKVGF
jgi:hypothetical protein